MGIASLVAWLWMAGQGGNVVSAQDVAKWGYSGYLRTAPPASVAPASHVVEIRTKRNVVRPALSRDPNVALFSQKDCPMGYKFYSAHLLPAGHCWNDMPNISHKDCNPVEPARCERVTREIWIDGVKWGVLKESQP